METVTASFQWLLANWDNLLLGAASIVAGASVIAKLTPTPKDDAILAKVVNVLDFLALNKQRY